MTDIVTDTINAKMEAFFTTIDNIYVGPELIEYCLDEGGSIRIDGKMLVADLESLIAIIKEGEQKRVRQFVIFSHANHEEQGGMRDMVGSVHNIATAVPYIENLNIDWDHAQIVDRDTWEIVREIKND